MIQQIEKLLTLVGQKYMEDQRPTPYQFRVTNYAGFTRGKDCRYDLNMIEALPDLQNNQYVYAWSKLWIEEVQELPFSLSCYGPAQVFLNGERVHYANIEEEVFPERRSWFRLSLAKGWNHFVLRFMKTETGCGAKFGTGSIKGFPLHFIMPSLERAGGEGWIYTEALKAELPFIPSTERSEYQDGIRWYPDAVWRADENKLSAIERIFTNGEQGNYAIGWAMISNETDSAVHLAGRYKGELQVFIDGQLKFQALSVGDCEHDFEFTVDIAKGRAHSLMIQLQHTAVGWGFKFNDEYLKLNCPVHVEGTSENWLYSGPYLTVNEAVRDEMTELSNLHTTKNGLDYWYIDAPFSRIRPFVETTHYGKWNYPLGVTLYGLLSAGKILSIESFESYVQNHIELCTKYYEYAKWDCKQYGAPGINQQIVLMDSLDDCGSFGATMLFTMESNPLVGSLSVAERIAGFITDEQQRLPDGTLYRLKGSTDFMQQTMWCDDLYMSVPFLVRYYRYTKDIRYLDDAVHQILQYRHYLYREELQIMHHVYDMKFNKQNTVSWGRGNGWVIFSLAELLAELSPQHERYGELLTMFRQLSQGFQQLQGERGMWHQIVDDHDSYEETSCTAMFIYAFARGVRNGWYDNPIQYVESAYYGWQALAQYAVDEEGNILGVCRGSGYSYNYEYYKYDLLPRLNDTHGIGIVMLAGIEIIKLRNCREFTGAVPKINALTIAKQQPRQAGELPTVYLAGDSTVQTYDPYWQPQAGWGQMLPIFFNSDIIFNNQSIGGRSSKSFIVEGRLDDILRVIQPGDYFLIQFGHNDATISVPERYASPEDYKEYLKTYINGTRQRGAEPILVTPMGRRDFNSTTGKFNVSFPAYVEKMKELASELDVLLVDLSTMSIAYYDTIGPEGSKSVFLHLEPGIYGAFPNGSVDDTHFQEYGAIQIARLLASGIQELESPLSAFVKEIELPK